MAFAIALGLSERVGVPGATGGGSALRDDPADRRGPTILPRVLMLPRVLREIDPRAYWLWPRSENTRFRAISEKDGLKRWNRGHTIGFAKHRPASDEHGH